MSRERRSYSDREKAEALAHLDANGGNVSGTAKQLGIPRVTLLEWSKERHINEDVSEIRQEKKEELADLFEKVARAYLGRSLESHAVSDTKGKEAVIAAATALDKLQLLKGQPTQISEQRTVSLEAVVQRAAAELLKDAEADGVEMTLEQAAEMVRPHIESQMTN